MWGWQCAMKGAAMQLWIFGTPGGPRDGDDGVSELSSTSLSSLGIKTAVTIG